VKERLTSGLGWSSQYQAAQHRPARALIQYTAEA
jgi:ribosomal protein S9